MSINEFDITEQDIRDYCTLRMPTDSPKYEALSKEFLEDPENSYIGRYCRETERVVRLMNDDSHLDFEKLMLNTCGTKNENGDIEFDLAAFLAGDDENEGEDD